MSALIVLQQMAVITVLVCIGIILGKNGTVDKVSSKSISTLVIDVCNPALMITSALNSGANATHDEIITIVLLSIGFYVVLLIVGVTLPILTRVEHDKRKYYNMMCVYTNVGFIGIPVCRAILPSESMLCVLICNVIYALLFYTHGVLILSGGREKINLSRIISPGTIAAIISVAIFWFDVSLPQPVCDLFGHVGNATTFLSMMLLGVAIARAGILDGLKNIQIWLYVLLRMIAFPIGIFLFIRSGVGPAFIVGGMTLMATMPIGNLPLIQAEKTGQDTSILSRAITISTVVSVGTITLVMSLV